MSITTTPDQTAFLFKTSPVTLSSLQLQTHDLAAIGQQLTDVIKRSPQFFVNAPIVIDCHALDETVRLDIDALIQLLAQHQLRPVGIRSLPTALKPEIERLQLALFAEDNRSGEKATLPTPEKTVYQPTLTITQPVRSGQQIYAKNSDLLVIAPVSAGAELLADGNIYVYGALRGRALAGVNGNEQARIFCRTLDAELISIAGYYQISENMINSNNTDSVHIFLSHDKLCIETL